MVPVSCSWPLRLQHAYALALWQGGIRVTSRPVTLSYSKDAFPEGRMRESSRRFLDRRGRIAAHDGGRRPLLCCRTLQGCLRAHDLRALLSETVLELLSHPRSEGGLAGSVELRVL